MICLVDERISAACERALLKRGYRIVKMPKCERLSPPIASHPDMLLFLHDDRLISSADYCERYPYVFSDIREMGKNISMTFTEDIQKNEYPYDAIFNALTVKNYIFYKEDTVSAAIKEYAKSAGLTAIPTKQGYPACTTLAFGGAAITADRGMARVMSDVGIKVTLIENGSISLPPYDYGFIGGAAGSVNKEVYFLGNLDSHPSCEIIKKAVFEEGYLPISLSDEPLSDLGRILFID